MALFEFGTGRDSSWSMKVNSGGFVNTKIFLLFSLASFFGPEKSWTACHAYYQLVEERRDLCGIECSPTTLFLTEEINIFLDKKSDFAALHLKDIEGS